MIRVISDVGREGTNHQVIIGPFHSVHSTLGRERVSTLSHILRLSFFTLISISPLVIGGYQALTYSLYIV